MKRGGGGFDGEGALLAETRGLDGGGIGVNAHGSILAGLKRKKSPACRASLNPFLNGRGGYADASAVWLDSFVSVGVHRFVEETLGWIVEVKIAVQVHYLILGATALGVVVIGGDADHIGGVDLEDHHMAIGTGEMLEIFHGAEVQSVRAGAVFVVVHRVAGHRNGLTHRVVERTAVNVFEVRTNRFVGQEAAVGGNGQIAFFKKPIKFIGCSHGRVLHQVFQELGHGAQVETFVEHFQHTFGQVVAHLLAFVRYDTRVGVDGNVIAEGLGRIAQAFDIALQEIHQRLAIGTFANFLDELVVAVRVFVESVRAALRAYEGNTIGSFYHRYLGFVRDRGHEKAFK